LISFSTVTVVTRFLQALHNAVLLKHPYSKTELLFAVYSLLMTPCFTPNSESILSFPFSVGSL